MSLFSLFKTDETIERDGVWLEYGGGDKPIRIRIARAGGSNMRFAKVLEHRTKPYRRQIQNEQMAPEKQEEVLREVYADAVVLGWENVTLPNENGTEEELSFNRDNVIRLFKELPDLFVDVREQAAKAALFKADIREEAAKN